MTRCMIDSTHDPKLCSWVTSANKSGGVVDDNYLGRAARVVDAGQPSQCQPQLAPYPAE